VKVGSNASGVEVGAGVKVGLRLGVLVGGGVSVKVAGIAAGVFVVRRGRLEWIVSGTKPRVGPRNTSSVNMTAAMNADVRM
jgi:hypothetical protein